MAEDACFAENCWTMAANDSLEMVESGLKLMEISGS